MTYQKAILSFLYRIGKTELTENDYLPVLKMLPDNVRDERVKFIFGLDNHISWSRWCANTVSNFFTKRKYVISKPTPELKNWNDQKLIELLTTIDGAPAEELLNIIYKTAVDMTGLKTSNEKREEEELAKLFPQVKWVRATQEEDKLGTDYKSEDGAKKLQVKVCKFEINNTTLFDKEITINLLGRIDLNVIIKYPHQVDRILVFEPGFKQAVLINHNKFKMLQKSIGVEMRGLPTDFIHYGIVNNVWKKIN
jgi:hypothetical protein